MRALAIAVALAAAVVAAPASVHAQVAEALGQPLPGEDLDPGTVTIRVIAGSPRNAVAGVDVTMTVDGTPRQARTDDAGRATFKDLPVGATVQASVMGEDQKPVSSAEFQIPADGGMRLLLSTRPFQPDGGGAPFAPFAGGGGGGGMPEPRLISGQPRPEPKNSPGTITVRLTYDDLAEKQPPAGVPVLLVGYHADHHVDAQSAASDATGHATFSELDVKGETSYFAIAELPRGAIVDRLISLPCVLDARAGVALALSAAKRDSTEPAIDELSKFAPQTKVPAAGKLHVQLAGWAIPSANVRVVAIAAGGARRVISEGPAARAEPDPADVHSESEFEANADVAPHTVHVIVAGGANQQQPLGGVAIAIVPAKQRAGDPTPATAPVQTPASGELDVPVPIDGQVIAVLTVNGKEIRSKPFDVSKQGGVLEVLAMWEAIGKLVADVDVSAVAPGDAVYAEAEIPNAANVSFRSAPFPLLASAGAVTQIDIAPPIQYTFSLTSHVDDEFLAVQGTFEVRNNTWTPYTGGPDGMVVALPAHFRGAQVAERDQGEVAVADGKGFRIGRTIPPGGIGFVGGFSLPVENGVVSWALDLPIGTVHSGMEILESPGMSVDTPAGAQGEVRTAKDGRPFYVLPDISITPNHSMTMTIRNLPTQPRWRVWAPRIVGAFAVLVMLAGLGIGLGRTRRTHAEEKARAKQREQLLDELAALEPGGKSDKRRAQITDELEALWDE